MSVTTYTNMTTDPDTPSSGEVKLYMKDKAPAWRDDTGAVNTLSLPVFGQEFELSVFDDVTSTTTGSAWSAYIGLQIPAGLSGTFLVFVNVVCRMSATGGDAWVRLAVDGATIGHKMSEELKDSSADERATRTLIKKITLTGSEFVDLDFATEKSGDTLTIYEGSLVMWRVS